MQDQIKIIAASTATIIAVFTYIPYLIDMFRGKNKPHVFTWVTFTLITVLVAWLQFSGGAGIAALPTAISALVDLVILVFCLRYGTKDIITIDKICLAISLVGIFFYVLLRDIPSVSLIFIILAEAISFIPTFRKTHTSPFSESLPSYYLTIIKLLLVIIAIKDYNFLTLSYPVAWIFIFVVFLVSTYFWRLNSKLAY